MRFKLFNVDFEISYEMNGILLHANQNLKILPRTPISISVSKLPTKTSYLHGEQHISQRFISIQFY